MFDRSHVFRRAFSWLPSHFASQSEWPVGPREFRSTEHLSIEAIAAFVDGELDMRPHLRAATHLSLCSDCAAEVDAQVQAREALRDSYSYPIDPPTSLVGRLSQIPYAALAQPDEVIEPTAAQLADDTTRDRRQHR
jgi:hypothetical protein